MKKKKSWRSCHFTHVYHKWQSYDVWFLRHWAWWTEFFVILDHFLPFYPLKNLKNQNFKKMKKMPGDNIFLQKCTKNHNHMVWCSWDIRHDGCNCYFSLWAIFCPFTPPPPHPPNLSKKGKIKKNEKKHMEISSLYTSVPKIMIICYTVPEMWHMTDVIAIFHFGLFFALLPSYYSPTPLTDQKIKISKN